ncbi:MAG: response regulator [Bacteroidetes bacterium]|nr:response regulator [Bacteroidota bacterium]
MKLLIVDDSILLQERLAGMIGEIEGIEICGTAGNTLEGFELTKKLNPDIITVDISMPGGGGIKLLEKIKDYNANIIVIILTNYPYQEYKDKCFELGADYLFSKMKEIDSFMEVIGELSIREKNAAGEI